MTVAGHPATDAAAARELAPHRNGVSMLKAADNEYISHTGPGTPMGEFFRAFYLPVLLSEELPRPDCDPVRVTILGEPLVAFRDTEGRVGLLDEACPHRTASLYFGRNEDCGLRCTYHGWKFDVNGRCVDMPNEPATSTFKDRVRANAYPVVERGGVIWANLGGHVGEDGGAQVPGLEWTLVPDEHRFVTKVYVDCNYLQAMEGDIDSSHSAFLHSRPADQQIDRGTADQFRQEDLRRYSFSDKAPRFFTVQTDNGMLVGARRTADEDNWYWRVTQWMLPTYSLIPREEGHLLQCNMRVPADDGHHWFFRCQYHPDRPLSEKELQEFSQGGNVFQELIPGTYLPSQTLANDFLIDREVQRRSSYSGIKGIPTQDQSVTITMGPVADRSREHLGTTDAAIIAARRRLLDSARFVEGGGELSAPADPDAYLIRAPALLLPKEVPFDEGAAERIWAPNTQRSGPRPPAEGEIPQRAGAS
jgi:phenylpropionate dioxygenase-like ring-hydroxylating dioxygenase large terminal subunit